MRKSRIKFSNKFKHILRTQEKLDKLKSNFEIDRDLEMAREYIDGSTLTEVANKRGISRERARQIVERLSENQEKLLSLLGVIEEY